VARNELHELDRRSLSNREGVQALSPVSGASLQQIRLPVGGSFVVDVVTHSQFKPMSR
jgi:hypothetical protein